MISINTNYKKLINIWFILLISLIFLMVIVGGFTRLTDSGLSITSWELFSGVLPPFNENGWSKYFSEYKKIPQYYLIYPDMTLSEFKVIFYWEYFHRLLGRLIGIFFLIPLLYFFLKKVISKSILKKLLIIFLLILLQGLVGWYMVKSGLSNNVTVSHYRLSTHLVLAFIIVSSLFWIFLNFNNNTEKKFFSVKKNFFSTILILLIFVQIIFGAFVSGLDAGKIYQTWPLMNYNYFPDDYQIKNFFDILNFDNRSWVQFIHRNVAYVIMAYCLLIFIYLLIYNLDEIKYFYLVLFTLLIQIFLGILTLITGLNIYLAGAHQISSLILLFSIIYFHYRIS